MEGTQKYESQPGPKLETLERQTVRVVVYWRGKFLVLQKNATSNDPLSWEFPGGKIDGLKEGEIAIIKNQKSTAIKEVKEETDVDISSYNLKEVEEFETRHYEPVKKKEFDAGEVKIIGYNLIKTKVKLFLVVVPDDENLEVKINQTFKEDGMPEDNHNAIEWLTKEELLKKATMLEENPAKLDKYGKPIKERPLARRSRYGLKKLFALVEKLKEDKQNEK